MARYISEQHERCITVYHTLLQDLGGVYLVEGENATTQLRDHFDRYQVWAANLGVKFHGVDYKRSLDYRLRQTEPYKEAILKILERIESLLQQSIQTIHNSNESDAESDSVAMSSSEKDSAHEKDDEGDNEDNDDGESSWSLSSDDSLDAKAPFVTAQHIATVTPGLLTATRHPGEQATSASETSLKLALLLKSLDLSITSLYKIPIRTSTTADQAHYLARRYNIDLSHFEPFDIAFVKDLFPSADQQIILRLGRMVTWRRQALRSRWQRNEDLQREALNSTKRLKVVELLSNTLLPSSKPDLSAVNEAATERAPSRIETSLKATTFRPTNTLNPDRLNFLDSAPSEIAESVTSVATTNTAQDLIAIPHRPLNVDGAEKQEFECPFCSTLVRIKTAHSWKKHVLSDLQPYTCTYVGCDEPDLLFADQEAWNSHEMRHLCEYQCGDLSHSSCTEEFTFLSHMKEKHALEGDIHAQNELLKLFLRPQRQVRRLCTLCHTEPKNLKSHLGRHLQRIALFSLPRDHTGNDEETASQVSNIPVAARHSPGSGSGDIESRSVQSTDQLSLGEAREPPFEAGDQTTKVHMYCENCDHVDHDWGSFQRNYSTVECPRCGSKFLEIVKLDANTERYEVSNEAEASTEFIPDSDPTVWDEIRPVLLEKFMIDDQPNLNKEMDDKPLLKPDFSFQGPAGICLDQAPYMDPELFVGRNYELEQMDNALDWAKKTSEFRHLCLTGVGGIGKTQLAVAYARYRQADYRTTIWLDASSIHILRESFRLIACQIFATADVNTLENDQIATRMHQWLSDAQNTTWLLIFDGLNDQSLFSVVDAYYPRNSHGTVIVTTRLSLTMEFTTMSIRHLSIDESVTVLRTRSQSTITDDSAAVLCGLMGGHPLTLAIAGSSLDRFSISPDYYANKIEESWLMNVTSPPPTVRAACSISYSQLKLEDPDAARLLKLLAFFDSQSVWYTLLCAGMNSHCPEWLSNLMVDNDKFADKMRILQDRCFLGPETSQRSWTVHATVHDWVLTEPNDISTQEGFEPYWYTLKCIVAAIGINSPYHGHLTAHAMWLMHEGFKPKRPMQKTPWDQLTEVVNIAKFLFQQGEIEVAKKICAVVVGATRTASRPTDISTLVMKSTLGALYRSLGDLSEAEFWLTRALAGCRDVSWLENIELCDASRELGLVYRDNGKLEMGEAMLHQALEGYKKQLGRRHPTVLSTIYDLGGVYESQGKLEMAQETYKGAMNHFEVLLGSDDPMVVKIIQASQRLTGRV